jgi:hypothetical protein
MTTGYCTCACLVAQALRTRRLPTGGHCVLRPIDEERRDQRPVAPTQTVRRTGARVHWLFLLHGAAAACRCLRLFPSCLHLCLVLALGWVDRCRALLGTEVPHALPDSIMASSQLRRNGMLTIFPTLSGGAAAPLQKSELVEWGRKYSSVAQATGTALWWRTGDRSCSVRFRQIGYCSFGLTTERLNPLRKESCLVKTPKPHDSFCCTFQAKI